jgi:hypothetical protein
MDFSSGEAEELEKEPLTFISQVFLRRRGGGWSIYLRPLLRRGVMIIIGRRQIQKPER